MSPNKQTVQDYMDGFRATDHDKILGCLTDDVVWVMPGAYHHEGKDAFDNEIENPNFKGKPLIKVFRMTEENDVVIAEGAVTCSFINGDVLDAVFCDVFEMRDTKIQKLTSYLMQIAINKP
ncbi:nuclear transport factor 2 family protein [Flavobacterium caeni]|nr:nuclear transport factor 2 family protein [Flavobacterium caeni]